MSVIGQTLKGAKLNVIKAPQMNAMISAMVGERLRILSCMNSICV